VLALLPSASYATTVSVTLTADKLGLGSDDVNEVGTVEADVRGKLFTAASGTANADLNTVLTGLAFDDQYRSVLNNPAERRGRRGNGTRPLPRASDRGHPPGRHKLPRELERNVP
jgi:hypothetical protein